MSRAKENGPAARLANKASITVLRIMAGVLLFGAISILVRGYIVVDGHKEAGAKMYYVVVAALFWVPILWLWSRRK